MDWAPTLGLLLACLIAGGATWWATRIVIDVLTRLEIFDRPNARSSHDRPRVRGGGLALIPVVTVAWVGAAIWLSEPPPLLWLLIAGLVLLAVVSWLDDLDDVEVRWRLAAQGVAVALGLFALSDPAAVFQGWLPLWLALPPIALAWVWFVNLFNFMDGIDGISGVEAIALGLGVALIASIGEFNSSLFVLPAMLAAAAAGFLAWNWHPARIFLGDVGSVPLGFLLAWLLLELAAQGAWAAALILPAYYLADATVTLAQRAWRREAVWQAHKEHFYQRAVQAGHGHDRVALAVAGCNLLLIALAALSLLWPWPALLLAALTCGLFLAALQRWRPAGDQASGQA